LAHRTFLDTDGRPWQVWDVYPQWAERRIRQRRASDIQPVKRDRRRRPERRVHDEPPGMRVHLTPGFEGGWLRFESGDERRRLAPIPLGWEGAPEHALRTFCREARAIAARRGRLIE
jgi:hypothetical protein